MTYKRNLYSKSAFSHISIAILFGVIGSIVAVFVHAILKIKFWGLWFMNAGSALVLVGGLAWVLYRTLSVDISNGQKPAILKGIKSSLLAAVIPATLMGIVAISAAWDHNPGMSVHKPGFVDWSYLLIMGGSWFLFLAGIVFILYSFFSVLSVFFKRWVR
jgi:hypothetical protein